MYEVVNLQKFVEIMLFVYLKYIELYVFVLRCTNNIFVIVLLFFLTYFIVVNILPGFIIKLMLYAVMHKPKVC